MDRAPIIPAMTRVTANTWANTFEDGCMLRIEEVSSPSASLALSWEYSGEAGSVFSSACPWREGSATAKVEWTGADPDDYGDAILRFRLFLTAEADVTLHLHAWPWARLRILGHALVAVTTTPTGVPLEAEWTGVLGPGCYQAVLEAIPARDFEAEGEYDWPLPAAGSQVFTISWAPTE